MRTIASGGMEEEHKPPTGAPRLIGELEKKGLQNRNLGPKNSKRTVKDFTFASRAWH